MTLCDEQKYYYMLFIVTFIKSGAKIGLYLFDRK